MISLYNPSCLSISCAAPFKLSKVAMVFLLSISTSSCRLETFRKYLLSLYVTIPESINLFRWNMTVPLVRFEIAAISSLDRAFLFFNPLIRVMNILKQLLSLSLRLNSPSDAPNH